MLNNKIGRKSSQVSIHYLPLYSVIFYLQLETFSLFLKIAPSELNIDLQKKFW